jgi:hypothetical protein
MVSASAVLALAPPDSFDFTLVVEGNDGDGLVFSDLAEWTPDGTLNFDGAVFNVYRNNNDEFTSLTVRISEAISVTGLD